MKKEEWKEEVIENLSKLKDFIFQLKVSKILEEDRERLLKYEEQIDETLKEMKSEEFDLDKFNKVKLEDVVMNIFCFRIIHEHKIELENKLAKLFTDYYNSLED